MNVKALLRRRGALVALVTAAGVLAVLTASAALQQLFALAFGGIASWDGVLQYALASCLPIAFGVFVSLWLILPIDGALDLRFVISRALAALIPAAVLLLIGQSIWLGVIFVLQPEVGSPAGAELVGSILATAGSQALSGILEAAPLILLAVLLQWHWLRQHPPEFDVAGVLDV